MPLSKNLPAISSSAVSKKKRKRHKNSKFGCANCKKRRIKCGEELDSCFNCLDKNYRCGFLDMSPQDRAAFLEHKRAQNQQEQQDQREQQERVQEEEQNLGKKLNLPLITLLGGYNQNSFLLKTTRTASNLERNCAIFNSHNSDGHGNISDRTIFSSTEHTVVANHTTSTTATVAAVITSCNTDENDLPLSTSGDYLYKVEKLKLQNGSTTTIKPERVSKNSKRNEKKLFLVTDFNKNWQNIVKPSEIISLRQVYISNKQNLMPLTDHIYTPTSFKLIKYNELYNTNVDDDLCYNYITQDKNPRFKNLVNLYGEEDTYNRDFVLSLYEAVTVLSKNQLLLFLSALSYATATIYNQASKKYFHQEESMTNQLNFKTFLLKYNQNCREKVNDMSQSLVERLNTLKKLNDRDCYFTVTLAISHTLTSVNSTLLLNCDYKYFYDSLNEYLTTVLAKPVYESFKWSMDRASPNDKIYKYLTLLDQKITFIHVYCLRCITSIHIPNYNFNVLIELYDSFMEFGEILTVKNVKDTTLLWKLNNQFKELKNYSNEDIFKNTSLLSDYAGKDFVLDYKPEELSKVLKDFLQIVPSEVPNIAFTYKSLTVLERVFYLYWVAHIRVLNNIFHETSYLFLTNFFGNLTTWGNNLDVFQLILRDIEVTFKFTNYQLYDFLYRKVVYLARLIFFFSYRTALYSRNVEVFEPFPNNAKFEKLRFKSRKLRSVKETQIQSFKKAAIKFENYPVNDANYTPASIDLFNPGHNSELVNLNLKFSYNAANDCLVQQLQRPSRQNESLQQQENSENKLTNALVTIEKPMDENFYAVQNYLEGKQSARQENSSLQLGEALPRFVLPSNGHGHMGASDDNVAAHGSYCVARHDYNERFDLDTCPLELLKLSKYGLLQNIDYTPRYSDWNLVSGEPFKKKDYDFADYEEKKSVRQNDIILQHYAVDRMKVLDYFDVGRS